MPATIIIPPHYWAGETQIELLLTDSSGHMYAAEIVDASGFVGGRKVITVGISGATFTLPTNDEFPAAPGDAGNSSQWQITIREARYVAAYRVSISSANPPTNWNELIEAGTPVNPADIWSGLLLPADAVDGEYARKSAGPGWEAVPPPAGTGDVSGPEGGVADGDMAVFQGTTGKIIRGGGPPGSGGGIPEPADDGIPKLRQTDVGVSTWVDAGQAALMDVGPGSGDVASGDHLHPGVYDPAGTASAAVAAHESAQPHDRIPTAAQKDALDAAPSLSAADPAAAISDVTAVSDDLSTHKTSADHDARYDPAGTASAAVAGHEGTFSHGQIPSLDQSQALDANPKLSAGDAVAALSDVVGVTTDELVSVSATDTAGYLSPKLYSSDASVSFTTTGPADDQRIDIKATGPGGGEANRGENIGGAVEIYAGMNGTQLQLRTLATTTTVAPSLAGNTIEFAVPGGQFDPFGSAAAVDASLTAHIASGDHDARYAVAPPAPDGNTYSMRDQGWVLSPVTPIGGIWTQYTWSSDTSGTSPGSGGIKANDADQASATEIYVHRTTSSGNDAHDIWMSFQAGDYLGIWEDLSDREGIYYEITGAPQDEIGWYKIPVQAVPGWAGGIENGRAVAAFLARDARNRNPVGGAQYDVLRKAGAADHLIEWHTLIPSDIGALGPGTPFAQNDLLAVENIAGTVQTVGFSATDVARLSQPILSTSNLLRFTNASGITLDLFSQGGADRGRWHIVGQMDELAFRALTDAGIPVETHPELAIGHSTAGSVSKGVVAGNVAFQGYGTIAAQNGLYDGSDRVYSAGNPPPGGGGWQDGTTIADWGETGQSVAASGNETFDLDNGHHFYSAAAMIEDKTINFQSTANHAYTFWSALLDIGSFTPTFQFNSNPIKPAEGYKVIDGGLFLFTFAKSGADYVVSERRIP